MTSEFDRPILINQYPLIFLFTGFICALFFTGVEGCLFFFSQAMLWLFTLAKFLQCSGSFRLPCSAFSIVLTAFLLFCAMTLLWSPVPGYTQVMLWRQGALLLLFYSLLLIDDTSQWKFLKIFLSISAIALAGAALWQYFNGWQPEATFLNRNSLAGFLVPLLFWAVYRERGRGVHWLLRIQLFMSALVLGLIGSRGAFLSVAVGAVLVLLLSRIYFGKIHYFWRQAVVFASGLVASVIATGFSFGQGLGRLGTLQNPWSAGESRFMIWESSLEMLKDAPWHGLGVGIYGLIYPQYRLPADGSAGHFAHNDLLQIGIETGFIGILLCLLVCVLLAVLVGWSLKDKTLSQRNKSEIIVLAGGLSAVLFHSLLTFNLYVYSTLLVIGIVLARLYSLTPDSLGRLIRIDLSPLGSLMKYVPSLVCLIPLFLVLSGLYSQISTQKAFAALENDRNERAVRYLDRAKRFWSSNDFNWYMEGEIIRLGLQNDNNLGREKRADLFSLAKESFEKAEILNPLRAATFHKSGLLLEKNGDKLHGQGMERIAGLYQQALVIDPRYFPARLDLARLSASLGQHDAAAGLLEEGLRYHYLDNPDMIPYLQFTGYYRQKKGDMEGVEILKQRIEKIVNNRNDQG